MTPITKSLVKKILESPYDLEWSIQGLGMLRLYLDDERRLHIWDDRYSVENVSVMHTHPWHFKSTVIAGVVHNTRFVEHPDYQRYYKQKIFCGEGGGLVGESTRVGLMPSSKETYNERESYYEQAHEVHISSPRRGTVTIVKREFLDDADHAFVYWTVGDWVSAEPRKATRDEIKDITEYSLKKWL